MPYAQHKFHNIKISLPRNLRVELVHHYFFFWVCCLYIISLPNCKNSGDSHLLVMKSNNLTSPLFWLRHSFPHISVYHPWQMAHCSSYFSSSWAFSKKINYEFNMIHIPIYSVLGYEITIHKTEFLIALNP